MASFNGWSGNRPAIARNCAPNAWSAAWAGLSGPSAAALAVVPAKPGGCWLIRPSRRPSALFSAASCSAWTAPASRAAAVTAGNSRCKVCRSASCAGVASSAGRCLPARSSSSAAKSRRTREAVCMRAAAARLRKCEADSAASSDSAAPCKAWRVGPSSAPACARPAASRPSRASFRRRSNRSSTAVRPGCRPPRSWPGPSGTTAPLVSPVRRLDIGAGATEGRKPAGAWAAKRRLSPDAPGRSMLEGASAVARPETRSTSATSGSRAPRGRRAGLPAGSTVGAAA